MRVAHLSDPHLLDLEGVEPRRLYTSKRLTGWLTIKLHRGEVHRSSVVEAMVADINAQRVDHVVVTGDLTNLALEPEFAFAKRVLAKLSHGPDHVSVIPGNHDVYTRGSQRARRFAQYFGEYITSDLDVGHHGHHPSGPFPFVRLRGPLAIIGLSSAVARPPLMAVGRAGDAQLDALERVLTHRDVIHRTPVVLIHHPLVNSQWIATLTHGLPEGRKIRRLLGARMHTGLVLHGHMHDRWHRVIPTRLGGTMHHIGATSASLMHERPHRMAGYNVYDFTDDGTMAGIHARVWNTDREAFVETGIERRLTFAES